MAAHIDATSLLRGRRHLEVRYESLAAAPHAELRRLMGWLGLDVEARQRSGWRSLPRHGVGGNKMRFESSEEIRVDTRWRRELTLRQRLTIRALTAPALLRATPLAGLARRVAVG